MKGHYITCYFELPEHAFKGWACIYKDELTGMRLSSGIWPTEAESMRKLEELAASLDVPILERDYEGIVAVEQLDEWLKKYG